MNHLLSILLVFTIVGTGFSQTKDNTFFKENPPNTPPAIFMASMPPCLIGVANQYGTDLGVSKSTLEKAKEFIEEAHKKVPTFKNQVRELEIALMKASKEERYDDYEKLLNELSAAKIKASLFHESLVKRARQVFDKEDIKILDDFIITNQEIFLKVYKL
ncbi:MAG: hypothetical protein ACK5M1_02330 [Xanthomarina gelatinilytica]|uniref:hypothetical protein n=1 Tax=Xanthomarina gelatinilytica TaxID=1137281 RepID=UPI003A896BD6